MTAAATDAVIDVVTDVATGAAIDAVTGAAIGAVIGVAIDAATDGPRKLTIYPEFLPVSLLTTVIQSMHRSMWEEDTLCVIA